MPDEAPFSKSTLNTYNFIIFLFRSEFSMVAFRANHLNSCNNLDFPVPTPDKKNNNKCALHSVMAVSFNNLTAIMIQLCVRRDCGGFWCSRL